MIDKTFFKNTLDDLKEFKNSPIPGRIESENASAAAWEIVKPSTRKEFEEFYKKYPNYADKMSNYTVSGKKQRLFEKIFKVISSKTDIETIVDFGCGVGADSMTLTKLGYKVTPMDLPSAMMEFFKFRIKKHSFSDQLFPIELTDKTEISSCDMILSLDVLEHVFNPFETLDSFFKANPKYILLTTAFGIHETGGFKIPEHTDFSVHKIEQYIEEHGWEKQKLKIPFPPRFFIRKERI